MRMRCLPRLLVATSMICAGLLDSVVADDANRVVNYEFQVFRLDGAFRTKTSADPIMQIDQGRLDATGGAVALFNDGQFDWVGDSLTLSHRGCIWNGKKLTFEEGYREKLPLGKMKMIYSPTVAKPLGQTIRLKIESDAPFQFMEKRPSGLFELNEMTLPVGMDLELVAHDEGDDKFRIKDLDIRLRSIGSRKKISGVSLPIGEPELREWNYQVAFTVSARKGYGILIRPEGTTGAMLIRVAISEK